ncbi:MAG: HK97 family phage prohead protease [Pseudomonadota bacterium]
MTLAIRQSSARGAIGYGPQFETKRLQMPLDQLAQDGSFSGYASVFGEVDLGRDRVQRGAFARSLREKGRGGVRMLFQHDPSDPIGTWQVIREDAHGLFVKGQITRSSKRGAEILELMRDGAVNGLSIGFRTRRSNLDRKAGIRTIVDADLWEISIVTFPMLPQARVEQVKSAYGAPKKAGPPSKREFERWLTRDAGLTRMEARTVMTKGFNTVLGKRDAADTQHTSNQSEADLERALRRAVSTLATTRPRRTSHRRLT